jgi:hypothetical protein
VLLTLNLNNISYTVLTMHYNKGIKTRVCMGSSLNKVVLHRLGVTKSR